MTRKEFEERMDKAVKQVLAKEERNTGDFFSCVALDDALNFGDIGYQTYAYFSNFLVDEYRNLYKPKYARGNWFGYLYNEENKQARANALLLFKEYCLDSQIYRGL